MSISCKVIKGLVDDVILGWDWMTKYEVILDTFKGQLRFGNNSVNLIGYDAPLQGPQYRVFEDLVLPPNSIVHTDV